MVVETLRVAGTLSDEEVDRLFHALADATRRDIVVRASTGDLSVSGLARSYPVSVTAIQKHVGVLEAAGLVERTRKGRETIVTTRQTALATAREVLDALELQWRERLDRFGDTLAELPQGEEQ